MTSNMRRLAIITAVIAVVLGTVVALGLFR